MAVDATKNDFRDPWFIRIQGHCVCWLRCGHCMGAWRLGFPDVWGTCYVNEGSPQNHLLKHYTISPCCDFSRVIVFLWCFQHLYQRFLSCVVGRGQWSNQWRLLGLVLTKFHPAQCHILFQCKRDTWKWSLRRFQRLFQGLKVWIHIRRRSKKHPQATRRGNR